MHQARLLAIGFIGGAQQAQLRRARYQGKRQARPHFDAEPIGIKVFGGLDDRELSLNLLKIHNPKQPPGYSPKKTDQ